MLNLLFVYGTLRSEFDNPYARLLREQARLLGRAAVRGSIFRIEHYPGFRPEPAGEVQGEIYRLEDPEQTLEALDEYEGSSFERVIVEADPWGQAWIYQFAATPPERDRISSGDFCPVDFIE